MYLKIGLDMQEIHTNGLITQSIPMSCCMGCFKHGRNVSFYIYIKRSLCDKPESELYVTTQLATNAGSSVMSVAISNYSKPQMAVHTSGKKFPSGSSQPQVYWLHETV
jgi:hypothetical protein